MKALCWLSSLRKLPFEEHEMSVGGVHFEYLDFNVDKNIILKSLNLSQKGRQASSPMNGQIDHNKL